MKRTIFRCILAVLILALIPSLAQPAMATELTEVKKGVEITGNEPALGMAISDLTATVLKARLEGIHVYNAYTEEEITEGCFENDVVYSIHYVLTPLDGQKFAESVGVTFNRGYHLTSSQSETRLIYRYTFTACFYISNARFSIPVLQAGIKPEEISISVPEDAHYTVENFTIIDRQDNCNADALQPGRKYRLQFTLLPNKGYVLGSNFDAYCNDAEMRVSLKNCCTYAECSIDFSLDVGEIATTWTTVRPNAGERLSLPVIYLSNERVKLYNKRWLDAQKNAVTDTVKGGEVYYLTFDIHTIGPVGALEMPTVTAGDREVTVEVIDDTHATVYVHFIGLHDMGKIQVTYQGFEKGKPVNGVTADIQGNARLSFVIEDDFCRVITDGIFESGKQYSLRLYIYPLDGYCIGRSSSIEVNGLDHTISGQSDSFLTIVSLDARVIIDTAKVNVSGVGVGKSISKVKVSPASGSKFDIWEENWAATDTSSTKFKKGELYQLRVVITADTGYRFTEDTVFMINGKKAIDISTGNSGDRLYGTIEFSYQTKITKVTLPAMPKSVSLGATLPSNFKVSSSANYTLQPVWIALSTQAEATTASQKDCYVLTYVVIPKDGCEFTEDTVFYVDGKKVEPIIVTSYFAEIMKPYNVGLTEIDRIDLTVAEPEKNAIPGTVSVSADAPYAPSALAWGVNTSGKLDDSIQDATVFENYKYHFLAVEFLAADGYAFADKVTVYINGNKFAVLEDYAFGPAYQMTVGFGKLGDIPKLSAPELTKSGSTLSWGGVRNADAYQIYRATSKSGKYTLVDTVTATTWEDTVAAGKVYYYKVKAVFLLDSAKNSGYSNVLSVPYLCAAPVIGAENASSGKPSVNWEKVSGAQKYTVYRATSENGKYSKLGTTTKLTYTDSKATAGNTYYYKVIANASSSSCNSSYSNIVSCNVICGTPSVSVKVDANTGKPSLSWKKVAGAAEYAIYRKLPSDADFVLLTNQTGLTYMDKDAPIDTVCTYKVQALGKTDGLNGQMSKEISETSGIAKPSVTGSLNTSGQPTLSWSAVDGGVSYEIYRSTKSSKGYTCITTVQALTYTDTSATVGKTYYYQVKAIGEVSKSADSSSVKLTGKCAAPVITVSSIESSGKPSVSWEQVSGAKKYTVYRATSENGKYSKLGTTTKLTYTDSKAAPGQVYYYKVIANASSSKYNSPYSNIVSCGVSCTAPTVKVSLNDSGKPSISWGKVTGAAKYEVYKNGVLLSAVTTTSYTDTTAQVGEHCTYTVKAINTVDTYNSALSEAVTVTATCATPKASGKVGANKKPVLTWDEVEGATNYVVYRSTSKSKNYKVIGESDTLTYEDLTAAKGKTYYYKVVAVGNGIQSAQSAYVKVKSK